MNDNLLNPVDRSSEVIFGLIMVLTFTGSLSAGGSEPATIHGMLIGAISCNLAWGIVDAVMFLMSNLIERSHSLLMYRRVLETRDEGEADRIIAGSMPSVISNLINPAEMKTIREKLRQLQLIPERVHLTREDYMAALAIFMLVFLSTFPVIIPFLFFEDAMTALRISNAIAVVMLFFCGLILGRYAGSRPWQTGLTMVIIGLILVLLTIVLGG